MNRINKTYLLLSIIGFVFLFNHFKTVAAYDLSAVCESGKWEDICNKISEDDCEKLCNDCLAYLNEKSAKVQKEINQTSSEKKTLQNQVSSLNSKVRDLENQISQSNLSIKVFTNQIGDTEQSIEETIQSISEQEGKIIELLRAAKEEDNKSFFEIFVTSYNLADFFDNMLYLETLSQKNKDVLDDYYSLHEGLRDKKVKLEDQTEQLKNLVIVQGEKKLETAEAKKEREYYLSITEKEYQQKIAEKKDIDSKAAQISARLFELVGQEGGGIEFGEAAKLARYAESMTGVKAELVLAIIHQESRFGHNVGQCYVTDFNTGNGTSLQGAYKARVMSPTRDVPPFLDVVKALGKDPKKTPVSCWIPMYSSSGTPYGWGGAMGPAQFIASTWKGVRPDVDALLGRTANPWVIKDAFLASAVLLKQNGALSDPYLAACRYYSGRACTATTKAQYGTPVMNKMKSFKGDLEVLEKSGRL